MICVYLPLKYHYCWLSLLSATYFGKQSPNNVPFLEINLGNFQCWKCAYFWALLSRRDISIELEEQISHAHFLSLSHTQHIFILQYVFTCKHMQTHIGNLGGD